jgi:hypothetical protein
VKICIIIVHFGKLPPWFPVWQITAAGNSGIDFHLFTDGKEVIAAKNVIRHDMDLVAFNNMDSVVRLGLKLEVPYKLCDLRPALAKIFPDLVASYDYWGWGDLDVVYGRIRECVAGSLGRFDYIATGWNGQSGPLALLRNHEVVNSLFLSMPNWREKMNEKEPRGLDEIEFLDLLKTKVTCDIVFRECLFDLPARLIGGRLVGVYSGREYVIYHFGANYPSIRASVIKNVGWLAKSLESGESIYIDRRGKFRARFYRLALLLDRMLKKLAVFK